MRRTSRAAEEEARGAESALFLLTSVLASGFQISGLGQETFVVPIQPGKMRLESSTKLFFILHVEHVVKEAPKVLGLTGESSCGITASSDLFVRHNLNSHTLGQNQRRVLLLIQLDDYCPVNKRAY